MLAVCFAIKTTDIAPKKGPQAHCKIQSLKQCSVVVLLARERMPCLLSVTQPVTGSSNKWAEMKKATHLSNAAAFDLGKIKAAVLYTLTSK